MVPNQRKVSCLPELLKLKILERIISLMRLMRLMTQTERTKLKGVTDSDFCKESTQVI